MPWLDRILAGVDMTLEDIPVLRYAAFLSGLYGADLEVLHIVENSISGASHQAERRDMYYRLLYRSQELKRRLGQHESRQVRKARLVIRVGIAEEIIQRLARTRKYQLMVVAENAHPAWLKLSKGQHCNVVPVRQDCMIPEMKRNKGNLREKRTSRPTEQEHHDDQIPQGALQDSG